MRFYRFLLPVLLIAAGCAAPRETAVVTDRPAMPPAAPPPAVIPTTPRTTAATTTTAYDTVRAGRFDAGKMWTFDDPPVDYFEEEYGFRPDAAWFERARLGALRFSTYCSASFVSPTGLVLTNHHCGRESVSKVSGEGEELLDNGFLATTLTEERKVEDLYVDQLVSIRDVTADVYRSIRRGMTREQQADARRQQAESLQRQLDAEAKRRDPSHEVQVVALYNGARYSAYTFRRYKDVRLVMAPELQLGFFGGDPDNFTYPRYSLDYAFFRVYENDRPFQTQNYFRWSTTGTREGEPVFVVGNPGSTSRLSTVAMLEYERDYVLPQQIESIDRRAAVLDAYIRANPEEAEEADLRNQYFSMMNSRKAFAGQLAGLRDPAFIARKRAAETALQMQIAENDTLSQRYGNLLREISDVQRSREAVAQQTAAFSFFAATPFESPTLSRALYGYFLGLLNRNNAPQSTVDEYRTQALDVPYWPAELDEAFLRIRMEELQRYLGEDNVVVRRVLSGQSPEEFARDLISRTALTDSVRYRAMVNEGNFMTSGDPAVGVIDALGALFLTTAQQSGGFGELESSLQAGLAQAQFALYGSTIPPDASFSLRIADGRVRGYPYNGTFAPWHTTFYGLYDRHYSHEGDENWALPERWLNPPAAFDLSTPLNLVSTNDITGGNSGSPLLNQNLEVVGLIFDSNIEALPNQYIYRDEGARAVSVDARGILETLQNIYGATRIAQELTAGAAGQ